MGLFAVALKIYLQLLPHVTNVCCLLLSGCFDPSSLRQRTLQRGDISGNSRGRFCNFAIRSNILHWAQVTVGIKGVRVLKNLSALAFQGSAVSNYIWKHQHLDSAYQKSELKGTGITAKSGGNILPRQLLRVTLNVSS